jgi:beta-glucosidase
MLAGCSADTEPPSDGANKYTTREVNDGVTTFTIVENPGGGTRLSYGSQAGFKLIEEQKDGLTYAFKDMNGNGKLDTWEDWRVSYEARAADLASQLAVDQISGLMLFSSHESAPSDGLTDAQKEYLSTSYLRNVLAAGSSDVEPMVTWTNAMQAYVETLASDGTPYVPVNFSSDPRHDAVSSYTGFAQATSGWPSFLGLAATFDPDTVLQFGRYASEEYRALGLANALSPQIDLASDPRWSRISGTFGEDPEMAAQMAANYVTGFQTTYAADGTKLGWGQGSVSTVIKHFPGDGASEGGRESHTESGKYEVFPGNNADAHVSVFEAAMAAGAGGMMTNYSITTDGAGNSLYGDKLVGTAYDKATIDIARVDNNYDGVIVTDWMVTTPVGDPSFFGLGMAWGAESLSLEERHFEILKSGVDQFGGNNDMAPIKAAFELWQKAYAAGELPIDAATRWAQTGERVLTNLFSVGLYDNPYQDLQESLKIVGNEQAVKAGLDAQHKSVVLLKNDNAIDYSVSAADWSTKKVYIPSTSQQVSSMFGGSSWVEGTTINEATAAAYFGEVVTDVATLDAEGHVAAYAAPDLSDVDAVIIGMDNPENGSVMSNAGMTTNEDGTHSFWPLSLQYHPYTADGSNVRKTSIAGNTLPNGSKENRSYFGATSHVQNEAFILAFERAAAAVEASGRDIPIIVVLRIASAMVIPAEFEPDADAIVVGFSVTDEVLLNVALGITEPAGRLPIGMPISMDAVEGSLEDVQKDIESYKDSAGNVYSYGFGLDSSGNPIR